MLTPQIKVLRRPFMFYSFPAFSMDTFDERTPEGWIAVEHESISYNVELIVDIQLR